MSLVDEVAEQLVRELSDATDSAAARGTTLAGLAGPDLIVEWDQLIAATIHRVQAAARLLAAQMCQDEDDKLAAQTVIDVMLALWPEGMPEDHDPNWWRTPLGRVCARSLGHDDSEAVTHSVAAAMLGVTRGTIAQLVSRGTLDRHPDGGVLRASVLQRLARS